MRITEYKVVETQTVTDQELERIINEYTEYWPFVLGVILLVILLFLPEGLIGLPARIRALFNRSATAGSERSGGGGT